MRSPADKRFGNGASDTSKIKFKGVHKIGSTPLRRLLGAYHSRSPTTLWRTWLPKPAGRSSCRPVQDRLRTAAASAAASSSIPYVDVIVRRYEAAAARSPHAPLRHRRNWKRKLALQKSRLTFKPSEPNVTALAPAAQPRPYVDGPLASAFFGDVSLAIAVICPACRCEAEARWP